MITFVLIFIIFYGASITNRLSYKIIILGKNFSICVTDVLPMLPTRTRHFSVTKIIYIRNQYADWLKASVWYSGNKTFAYLSPALRKGDNVNGVYKNNV